MKSPFLFTAVAAALLTTTVGADQADDPNGHLDPLIDNLSQSSLQEAFRLLRSDYIKRDDLTYLELNRAALQGLLERLDFGAMLLTEKGRDDRDSPFTFRSEKLTDQIGYVRFGKFKKKEIEELDKALHRFSDEKLETLILDLRSPQAQASFQIAASILSRFRPEGEMLFKIRRPNESRPSLFISKTPKESWDKPLILLIDGETGNVGEIIAAVLKDRNQSLAIGEATKGLTVEYRDIPIGEDRILRYAVAEVVLPDDRSLFQVGVTPDVTTPTSTKVKQAIFRETQETPLATFVFEKERPRMNEAALVAGTDPELEYFVAKSNGKPTEWDKPILRDRALMQAVDLLTTTAFFDSEPDIRDR